MIISFPRLRIFDVSDCHTPAVAVFMPVPSPAMTRPAYICPALYEAACMTAATAMTELPSISVRGRPSLSPLYSVDRAPAKQPRLYTDVIVPWSAVEG